MSIAAMPSGGAIVTAADRTIWISEGKQVPNVFEQMLGAAKADIEAVGLAVKVEYENISDRPDLQDRVVGQNPRAGDYAFGTVHLIAYKNRPPEPVGGWCKVSFKKDVSGGGGLFGSDNVSLLVEEGYSIADLSEQSFSYSFKTRYWDNEISMVHMPSTCWGAVRVYLYSGVNYTGERIELVRSVDNLGGLDFNDKAQSLKVETLAKTASCGIKFYQHPNRGGESIHYHGAPGTVTEITQVPSWMNDQITSYQYLGLRGCESAMVTIWEHYQYQGRYLERTIDMDLEDSPGVGMDRQFIGSLLTVDLRSDQHNFNDIISSIRIQW